ncbi:MAG: RNA 2',3'-cyclic phosphodiesterase [Alphaproteobacteria bacterium]|jgi:2'-5' RNA ligase|nr:RNA 2',3'-cyclic phosphodiesterase [Alphaproteobacteria bacterium]
MGEHRRLFLGIPLPEDVSTKISLQIGHFLGKVIPFQNWHITLHFLGNVEEARCPLVDEALQSLDLGVSFPLIFDHVGAFPSSKRARTLILGTKESPQMNALVQTTGNALTSLGFILEARPHVPHVTVRRFHPPKNVTDVLKTHLFEEVNMTVDHLILFESMLNQGPVHYERLNVYKFGAY